MALEGVLGKGGRTITQDEIESALVAAGFDPNASDDSSAPSSVVYANGIEQDVISDPLDGNPFKVGSVAFTTDSADPLLVVSIGYAVLNADAPNAHTILLLVVVDDTNTIQMQFTPNSNHFQPIAGIADPQDLTLQLCNRRGAGRQPLLAGAHTVDFYIYNGDQQALNVRNWAMTLTVVP